MGQRISIKEHTGYRGDVSNGFAYYDQWRGREVIYHVAPTMDAERHRRLIGNDIGIIFFLEVGAQFDPEVMSGLGTVPQCMCIVQPHHNKYRLTFMNRVTLRPYPGLVPKGYLFDGHEAKERILAKCTSSPHPLPTFSN